MKIMNSIPEVDKKETQDYKRLNLLLKENGVLVVRNFLSEEELKGLVKEFHYALESDGNSFIKPLDYSVGKACNIFIEKIEGSVIPFTQKVFSSDWMRRVAKNYLQKDFVLNKEIFFVKDVVGSKHVANDLHFDVQPTFKFFIYLNDTTKTNGAFACVPGSHKKADEIRKKLGGKVNYENRELTRELPYTEKDAVSVEGKAGSLIIFDTNVFHRAGTVSEGERWVMRGHTRPSKENTQGFVSKLRSLFRAG